MALERITRERAELVKALNPGALAIFESVSRRRHGVAVAEARDGIAQSATSGCDRRYSTPCVATTRSCSATAATGSSISDPSLPPTADSVTQPV